MSDQLQIFHDKIKVAQRIMDKCAEAEQEHVVNFIAELKKDCKTYKDVEKNFTELDNAFAVTYGSKCRHFLGQVRQALDDEKNGLPLVK